jgi:hypothetical protein
VWDVTERMYIYLCVCVCVCVYAYPCVTPVTAPTARGGAAGGAGGAARAGEHDRRTQRTALIAEYEVWTGYVTTRHRYACVGVCVCYVSVCDIYIYMSV